MRQPAGEQPVRDPSHSRSDCGTGGEPPDPPAQLVSWVAGRPRDIRQTRGCGARQTGPGEGPWRQLVRRCPQPDLLPDLVKWRVHKCLQLDWRRQYLHRQQPAESLHGPIPRAAAKLWNRPWPGDTFRRLAVLPATPFIGQIDAELVTGRWPVGTRGGEVPSITQDLAGTPTARWLRETRSTHRSAWNDRLRCFHALGGILAAHHTSPSPLGGRLSQPRVDPPGLLKAVAHGAHFSSAESVFQRWRAKQNSEAIRRWAGPDPAVKPREAFVAEAKIVSFWPYREGALAIADRFEMSLTEVAASYLRALGAWASDSPALAACVPVGPPPCVAEDMRVIARRSLARRPVGHSAIDAAASRLETLAGVLVVAVLDDASMTPLGAFNMVRNETLRLLADPPDPVIIKVSSALSELADRLLHRHDGEHVLTADESSHLTY